MALIRYSYCKKLLRVVENRLAKFVRRLAQSRKRSRDFLKEVGRGCDFGVPSSVIGNVKK